MSIFNDKEFRSALAATDLILPRSLWSHLNHIAQYMAMIGATDEALDTWKFAYSGLVLVPEEGNALGDCGVTALCRFLKHEDFSQGRPFASCVKAGVDVESRVGGFDHEMRKRLTTRKWANSFFIQAIDTACRAFDLARPPRGQRFSPTEVEALPYLDAFFANPETQFHAVMESHLLYADIATRHKMRDKATEHLRLWASMATSLNQSPDYVFGLYATAALTFRGALSHISQIPPDERRALIDELLQGLSVRLIDPHQSKRAPREVEVSIFYSTLSFEPASDEQWESEWELVFGDASPAPAANEAYPHIVSITCPGNSGGGLLSVEFPDVAPSRDDCDYAVAFPLRVVENERAAFPDGRLGTLFPTTPTGGKEDVGLDAPLGEYDVLARFFPLQDEDEFFRNWRIVLSLMPRGSLAFGVLKDEAD